MAEYSMEEVETLKKNLLFPLKFNTNKPYSISAVEKTINYIAKQKVPMITNTLKIFEDLNESEEATRNIIIKLFESKVLMYLEVGEDSTGDTVLLCTPKMYDLAKEYML